MGAVAAMAGAHVLQQHPAPGGAAAGRTRRPGRASLAVAHARRPARKGKDDVLDPAETMYGLSPELAGRQDELMAMQSFPDPANPPENLLDDSDLGFSSGEFDWVSSSSSGEWFGDFGSSGAGGAGGGLGQVGGAGAAADPFFEGLKSEDWADHLVKEVGEGNSFRREQRERYGAPIINMTNLAHATEEELAMGAEQQALRDDRVEAIMDKAVTLHHHFFEHATNRYVIAKRFGELLEEVESDDWNLPVEGEEQSIPSWCRAAFAMADEYDELNLRARAMEEVMSHAEQQFFEDSIEQHVRRQLEIASIVDNGELLKEVEEEATLESLLEGVLPGADDDPLFGSEALVTDLLTRAAQQADLEISALVADDDDVAVDDDVAEDEVEDLDLLAVVGSSVDEEEEEEEGVIAAAAAAGAPRAQRGAAAAAAAGLAAEQDPLLGLLDEELAP